MHIDALQLEASQKLREFVRKQSFPHFEESLYEE